MLQVLANKGDAAFQTFPKGKKLIDIVLKTNFHLK
jgi:hypothetical protein